ncbi:MAG: isoprenylcysteine carboxylmethyltransferase family protein [Candidatus Omnitrophota bacterium]|jgi:hypothetical protein
MKYRDRFTKLRFAFIYPIGMFTILFFNSTDISLAWGVPFVITGIIFRIWANGYAIKMDRLTTSGPYAFFQHPLYIGTLLIAMGFAIILNTYYIGLLFVSIVIAVYYRTIKIEEKMLEDKFNSQYGDYKKNFILKTFRITPYQKGDKWSFSLERLIRSKEHKTAIWIIILIIAIHIKEELIIEHELIDAKIWCSIAAITFLWIIDFIEVFIRSRKITG